MNKDKGDKTTREDKDNDRKSNERYEKLLQEEEIKKSSMFQDDMEVQIYPANYDAKFATDFFGDLYDEF